MKAKAHRKKIGAEESQRLLNQASEDYLRTGAKSSFEKAEADYGTDYASATVEIAAVGRQIRYEFNRLKNKVKSSLKPNL